MNDAEPNDEKSGAFPAAKNNKRKNSSPPPEDTPKHMRKVSYVQTNDEKSDVLPAAKSNELKNCSPPAEDIAKHMREVSDVQTNDEENDALPDAKNSSTPPEDTPKHIREVSDVQTKDEASDAVPVAKNNEPKNSSTPPEDTPKHRREMNDVQTNDEEIGSLSAAKNNKRKNSSPPPEETPKHIRYSDSGVSASTSSAIIPCIDRSSVDKVEDRPDDLFTCLPTEIILHVLNYLSLRDRRSVRLTCKTLNECSKCVSFTRTEKFVFPVGRYRLSTSLISEILSRTNSSVLNIEFRGDDAIMYSLSADVWKTCGDRVLSLSFHNCLPEIPMLQDILACCGNLEVIEFGEYFPAKKKLLLGYEFERVLNHSIQQKVECTQLHTVIMFHLEEIHASLSKKIFIVFPNVKYLHGRFHDPDLSAEDLKPFAQLRSLTYLNSQKDYHGMPPDEPISWLKFGTTPESPIRLTEFRTHLERAHLDSNSADSSLFRFVTSQDQLKIFSLSMPEQGPADSDDVRWKKQLMFHVLRCCPKLREFCFSLSQFTLLDTTDEIADFLDLISKLRCLKLSYLPQTPIDLPLPPVQTELALDTFQVTVSCGSSELLLHVTKHCPRMQHLFITEEPDVDILIEIFRSMPELRTLRIRAVLRHLRGREKSAEAFYDMRGLQNLEYLEVHAQRFEELPMRELQKYQFRRMKHVKLVVSPVSNLTRTKLADELREVLWNMPSVETVELSGLEQHSGRKLVKTFKKLKNLRRLVLHAVDEENVELLFRDHPTLKFVSDLSVYYRRTYGLDQSGSSGIRLIHHPLYTVEEQGALCRPFQDL